jgi:hypothetical protein
MKNRDSSDNQSQNPDKADMSNVLPNYDMSNVLPDYDMSNVLPDYDTSNVVVFHEKQRTLTQPVHLV